MSRIRTIKPEFFTSADIISLTPLSRLFYVSLWCESDREGRLNWNLKTFKFRYFPADNCDMQAMSDELVAAGLISIYQVDGKEYAEIPSFKTHQVINNRESESVIPARVKVACKRVLAEGKEGRKEGKEVNPPKSPLQGDLPVSIDDENEDDDPVVAKQPAIELQTYIDRCKQSGTAPIPEDDPVFAYVRETGIPDDFLRLHWLEFKARHIAEKKRQKSWPKKFGNSVRANWYRIWAFTDSGYILTTQGKQAREFFKGQKDE